MLHAKMAYNVSTKKIPKLECFRFFATPKNCEACEIPTTQIPYKIHGMDLLFNKWIYLYLESMNFTQLNREEKSFIFQNRIFKFGG